MNPKYLKAASFVSLVSLASFALSGCADTADGRKTQAQGTAGGAALGAAWGALTGYIVGGPNGAAGPITGSAHGFAYGSTVAVRKARYATAELWQDAEIAIARQANQRAIAYNQYLKARLLGLEIRAAAAQSADDRNALRSIKSEIGAIQSQTAGQVASEKQFVKDRGTVLGNGEAKVAANYGQYRKAALSWDDAMAERATLIVRSSELRSAIEGKPKPIPGMPTKEIGPKKPGADDASAGTRYAPRYD